MTEASWRYRGWRVVIACFTMALFAWGLGFYGHGVYLAELTRAATGTAPALSNSTVSAATTLYYLVSALLVAFVSDAIERLGPRLVASAGAIALALSAWLVSRIATAADLILAYLVMSVAWATLTIGAITNILGLWFRERRGLAISLALNGASAGGIVIAPLLVWLNGRMPFADTMRLVALVTAPVLLAVVLLWVDRPSHEATAPAPIAATGPAGSPITRLSALASLHFWTVAAPFALGLAAQVGFIVHQVAFLMPALGREGAALAVAVTTIMAVIGRVGVGLVIDRLDQRRVTALTLCSQAAALLLLASTDDPRALYLACAVFGFSVGNVITLPALIIQREYPAAAFGMLTALVVAINQVTYAFGPGLLGLVRDATGAYTIPLALCMAAEIAGALIVLVRAGRPPPDP